MRERSYVFEGTPHGAELERLRAVEEVFDPATRKHLLATTLGTGWRCLEVGAGAGSIARWMADTVGDSGRVLAVDLNTPFLSGTGPTNLDVREADIRTAVIDPESFDLATWNGLRWEIPRINSLGDTIYIQIPDYMVAETVPPSSNPQKLYRDRLKENPEE